MIALPLSYVDLPFKVEESKPVLSTHRLSAHCRERLSTN